MEVLNHNQRKSALWRIVGLFGLFLALVMLVLSSMNSAHGGQDKGEIQSIEQKIVDLKVDTGSKKNELKKSVRSLKNQVDSLSNDNTAENNYKALLVLKKELENELESIQDDFDETNESIGLIVSALQKCQSTEKNLESGDIK